MSGSTVSGSGLEVEEPEKPEDSPCWSGSAWLMLRRDLNLSTAFGATTRALSLPDWLGQVALSLQSSRSLSYPKTPCIGCNSLEVSGEEQGILGSDGLGVDGSEADSTLSTFVQLPLTDSSMDDFTSSYTMISISYITVGACLHRQCLHHGY